MEEEHYNREEEEAVEEEEEKGRRGRARQGKEKTSASLFTLLQNAGFSGGPGKHSGMQPHAETPSTPSNTNTADEFLDTGTWLCVRCAVLCLGGRGRAADGGDGGFGEESEVGGDAGGKKSR